AEQPLGGRADHVGILPRGEPDREARLGLDHERRVDELRLAAVDAVDVERRLGPRAVVEVVLRVRVERRRTRFVEDLRAGRKLLQARDLDVAERGPPASLLLRSQAHTYARRRGPSP